MGASADRWPVAGRYVLGGPLGRGGMGTVWRADDVLLGRPVAVKEVELPGGPPGADRVAVGGRALREARAAARLNHPGAVTLHDVVEADGRLFLVMELVEAPTLRELVEGSGPRPPTAGPSWPTSASPRSRRTPSAPSAWRPPVPATGR